MRYFLTGATGFLGGRLARRLRAQGHDVVALVRDARRAEDLKKLGVELHTGDITERASLQAPMTGVDGVLHCAAWYKLGVREPHIAHAVNVEGTRNVLETMQELQIPRGVYTSSLAVFSNTHGVMVDENYYYSGPHISQYDSTKWEAHYEVAQPLISAGLPLRVVLPGVIYGPGDRSAVNDLFVRMVRGQTCYLPRETAYCWSHVDDVVEGHILALERGQAGASYILSGARHTLIELAKIAEQVLNRPIKLRTVSPLLMRRMAALMTPLGALLSPSWQAETLRATAGVTYLGTSAKAQRELGFAPRSLLDGLREVLPQLDTKPINRVR